MRKLIATIIAAIVETMGWPGHSSSTTLLFLTISRYFTKACTACLV